jgi:PAS domain-containing protein
MMSISPEIKYILSAIIGGGLASFLTFRLNLKKQRLTEFQELIAEYKIMRNDMQQRILEIESELSRVKEVESRQREEIITLRNQLNLFESSHIDIPLPMWMKDTEGKMLFLNSQYEDTFLIPRGYNMSDYIGYKDHAVWSKQIADEFVKNDAKVIRTKKPNKTIELLESVTGEAYWAEVLKYPRTINNKVIGISGIILRTSSSKDKLL